MASAKAMKHNHHVTGTIDRIRTLCYIVAGVIPLYLIITTFTPSLYPAETTSEHVKVAGVIGTASTTVASESSPKSQAWPYTPFHTRDTQVVDNRGKPVTFVGVNWPGHGVTMVPEGLQYLSIADIVAKIKSLDMNVVRLTYATQMVDDIIENDGERNIGLRESFVRALGQKNGTLIYDRVVKLNPRLGAMDVKRLDVFNFVAQELAKQEIYVHLDNHISRAEWCCSETDGNGWFGDIYFNTTRWIRGVRYMTNHASTHWPSFTSTSLRNELRDTTDNPRTHATYNWSTWYDHMVPAIHAVHSVNTDPLIFVSGMDYDRTLHPIINGLDIGDGRSFSLDALSPTTLRSKLVWEIHNYNNSIQSCTLLEQQLLNGGYSILLPPEESSMSSSTTTTTTTTTIKSTVNIAPIVMTEFGFAQDTSTSSGSNSVYAKCLSQNLQRVKGGWMFWVIAGSYYERSGVQDYDETWGLLTRDWSDWRCPEVVEEYFGELIGGVRT